jgi:hypothetical protein
VLLQDVVALRQADDLGASCGVSKNSLLAVLLV